MSPLDLLHLISDISCIYVALAIRSVLSQHCQGTEHYNTMDNCPGIPTRDSCMYSSICRALIITPPPLPPLGLQERKRKGKRRKRRLSPRLNLEGRFETYCE
ncbi:hypothetical protein HOY82DRAFT_312495 [Tuber indicum]|nr:hypothetical protein HOY82DRAFT_312495 [Tuber indicum]